MKKLFGMTLLLMVSMIVSAQEDVVVIFEDSYVGGTVTLVEKKGQEVTITVTPDNTPDNSYYIDKSDVEVIAVMDPQLLTRSDAGMDEVPVVMKLELTGDDPADLTEARDYTFTVPEGLGAWVRTVTFHEVDVPITSGNLNDDVTWKVTIDDEGKTPVVTLTLDGDGSATLSDETAVPWESFQDQITDLVVSEGVTGIGKGLVAGCTALKRISLLGSAIVALNDNSVDGLTVDVAGQLYNEYKTTEGWDKATIISSDSEVMTGVAFGTGNSYDLFVTKEPMLVPSVLKAYTVTAISGSSVTISPVGDGIIPSGVPVLLYSETVKDNDFRTVITDQKGTAEAGLLRAAVSGGKEVELGGAYLLYNDVFYLSQAGTIPEGGVYIPVGDDEEKGTDEKKESVTKTRSFLTIGDDNTTAIDASRLSPLTSHLSGAWYTLDGRRLNSAPTRKGLYILNGQKTLIR